MSDTVIQVERLSKRYRLGLKKGELDTLRSALMETAKGWVKGIINRAGGRLKFQEKREHLWALKHVSFEVKRGEVLGVIGQNGAGKSTLLKILSRITEPTEGYAKIKGRVVSLLEVGTGFHPELTGRENVYLNAAILGMKKREIEKKFDEIVAFSGVEKFIDTPVKRYSSGMSVRLAFSVAAHLESEIMIIDEVLAVGDLAFQKKCLQKMDEVRGSGRTILFVSHHMPALASLCTKGIVMNKGSIGCAGTIQDAITFYYDQIAQASANSQQNLEERKDRWGTGKIRLTEVAFIDKAGKTISQIPIGGKVRFRVKYKSTVSGDVKHPRVVLDICNRLGGGVVRYDTEASGGLPESIGPFGEMICESHDFALAPGSYSLNGYFSSMDEWQDGINNVTAFEVIPSDYFGTGKLVDVNWSQIFVKHSWEMG